jgi:hypothetical protein
MVNLLLLAAGGRVEQFGDELRGARVGDGAQVVDQVLLGHAQPRVRDVQNVVVLVRLNEFNFKKFVCQRSNSACKP